MTKFTPRRRAAIRIVVLSALLAPILAACGGTLGPTVDRDAFTSKEYGVAVSERVTWDPNPPKGGGRYTVGQPYTVRGKTYYPEVDPDYRATGHASWYGSDFHGRRTANGEIFSANALTAAHPTLPLPSYVRVTNRKNGRSIVVRVNDRGPYVSGRVIDLSARAATMLGYVRAGSTEVDVEYVGRAPLEGDDTRMLLASYSGPPVQNASTTRVASAGSHTVVGMATNFIGGLFSYAQSTPSDAGRVNGAAAAVNAVAAGADLSTIDTGAQEIDLTLGLFAGPSGAEAVASAFALLGAVEETRVSVGGGTATQLRLTHLRPGVGAEDVTDLAHSLGLDEITLY